MHEPTTTGYTVTQRHLFVNRRLDNSEAGGGMLALLGVFLAGGFVEEADLLEDEAVVAAARSGRWL